MIRVLNRHTIPRGKDREPGVIYIGRGTPFGNKFEIGKDGDREQVLIRYHAWLLENPERVMRLARLIMSLRDKGHNVSLLCSCAPQKCHGDILVKELAKVGVT